jgi:sulfofructose kinase
MRIAHSPLSAKCKALSDRLLGDDWRGELILKEYKEAGVSTDPILIDPNIKSSLASILVRQRDGKRSIVYAPGTPDELGDSNVPFSAVAAAKILHVNGRHWGACLSACQHARNNDTWVSFDGGAHRYRPELEQLMPLTNICIVARDFAAKYTGSNRPDEAALKPKGAGPSIVVITDGANGSWIYSSNSGGFHEPAYLFPRVVDTTGCGDAYHGAFLFGLLRGLSLQHTARLASLVAGLNARKLGGRSGLPTPQELRSSMGDLKLPIDL